jgi:uncharacterized protein (TIGR03067 family)
MLRTVFPACVYLAVVGMTIAGLHAEEQKSTEVDGTWKLVEYIENGTPNADEVKANYVIVRKDGIQEITKNGEPFNKRKIEIDPTKTPKHIDFIDEKGTRVRGVYEIKGDTMKAALLFDDEKRKTERPADLEEKGNILAVYERVK